MRAVWESLPASNLDANLDYFLTVAAYLPETISPYVILIEREGRTPMLIVARLERRVFPVKVGYREIFRPRLRSVVVAFDGILGAETADELELCIETLRDTLRTRGIQAVVLQKPTIGSDVFGLATARARGLHGIHGLSSATRWLLDLPPSLDDLLEQRSARVRKDIAYRERKLFRDNDNEVSVVRLDRESRERLFGDVEAVAKTTYQRALGVDGAANGLEDALTDVALEHGLLRVWMLYLRGVPVAFWKGTVQGTVFAIGTPGYDPAHSKDHVGTYSMHRMIEDLCEDPAIEVIDYGHGDAEYKRRYSTRSLEQKDVVMLSNRPTALATGAFISTMFAANRLARRLLGDSGLAARLRRRWRSQATPTAQTSPAKAKD
jgi:hypothetical protein